VIRSTTSTWRALARSWGFCARRPRTGPGLTSALSRPFARRGVPPGWGRGVVLVQLAVAIALGATSVSDIAILAHQGALFGAPPSDSTVRRTLQPFDGVLLTRIAKARARVRAHVWGLIAVTERGFPWLVVAGKVLAGWVVLDLDATVIEASSKKQGAAGTFKMTYGFHPLAGWCANTQECLAMLLRPGNAGANTVADHLEVLAACIAQIPATDRAKILIRVDGAGASHGLLERIEALNTTRRTVRYTVGWKITDVDEAAITALGEAAWEAALDQDGAVQESCHVAELTGLDTRVGGWPAGIRLLVRRAHAVVEDRVRTEKAMGLRNLPSKAWSVNLGWVLAANIAADLDAWTRLLGLYDQDDLVRAEPDTLRYRLWHIPAKLTHHARRKWLRVPDTWPWAKAFLTCWQRLTSLPAPG
jgi:hypothetical protein